MNLNGSHFSYNRLIFGLIKTLIKSNSWLHDNDNNETITNDSKMISYDGMNS